MFNRNKQEKWEYKFVGVLSVVERLNNLGLDGWEIIGVSGNTSQYIMKRRVK